MKRTFDKSEPRFIDVACLNLSKLGEELCGDSIEMVRYEDGVMAVLSDGLGSGVKANILSTLTSKIAITMLKSGSAIEEVVNTIINTLPVCRVRNLAYSTFTIIHMLNSGKVYIANFDNPEIILRRGKESSLIRGEEVIIANRKVRESEFELGDGDTIVAISDGVAHAGIGAMLNYAWGTENISNYVAKIPGSISAINTAKRIISTCNHLYEEKPYDDATVIVMKYVRPKHVTLFTGPPLSVADDKTIVKKLTSTYGKKVVCGGTAAQIVAREIGQDIEVDTENINADIPPIAYIKGIDLVTEGVLTLKKALDILKEYNNDIRHIDEFFKNDKHKNGVYLLLKVLLDDATHINFIIGRRINPAHQNFDFPEELTSKLDIIKEIKQELKKLGKVVTAEYY
ncbi:serine phosphatase [Peptoclostridium acidaminophilum DSM 3953]|uniref:Serine phosphatase n=1 Tax=Peptoclostridium acidaminophilum DSM 3953 TaxID=1286171 RepID=W8TEE7_PEPAC|nr:SpoIIE family protein phosphatase [Peptoclostridium acidaminophilum]AHM56178.1 serine phosphatase [Peptoclostridium acidaminophilum DSM 3953]